VSTIHDMLPDSVQLKFRDELLRSSIKYFFILALSFLVHESSAQNISVQAYVQPFPSPYFADWEVDPTITYLEINSNNPNPLQITVTVVLSELTLGVIATATSVPIQIPPGQFNMQITNADYLNYESLTYDPDFYDQVTITGLLPDGEYEICSYLSDFETGDPLTEGCGFCNVISSTPPVLIYPVQSEVVLEPVPTFSWLPSNPQPQTPMQYMMKIFEVMPGQTSYQAAQTNPPFFTGDGLTQTQFNYDAFQLQMGPCQLYSWFVQEYPQGTVLQNSMENQGMSEVESFYYLEGPESNIVANSPGSECEGSVTSTISTTTVDFTFTATGQYSEFYILVCENFCGKYTPTTTTTNGGSPVVPTHTGTQTTNSVGNTIPTNVGNTISDMTGNIGNVIYVSESIPAVAISYEACYPQSYSTSVDMTGVIEPGSAFTYYVCGTTTSGETTTSPPKCDRYSPITGGGTVPTNTPCPVGPICQITVTPIMEPLMSGGLTASSKSLTEMRRDEFIPLMAEGRDFDQVKWDCIPMENCPETKSDRTIPLTGRVKFEWEIMEGEGSFKKLGCLPDVLASDVGERVIFQPPYIPLPVDDKPIKKITKIKLKIIDDNPTQPGDPIVERTVTIETIRKKAVPDKYEIKITSETYTLPGASAPAANDGTCKAIPPIWELPDNFIKPVIELPEVTDKEKMVVGEWIKLNVVDQRDPDKLPMICTSTLCTPSNSPVIYEDDVEFTWEKTGPGEFILGDKGRYVIYKAPNSISSSSADKVKITFKVTVNNPSALQIKDKFKKSDEFVYWVYKAGIKVTHPVATWLPEDTNSVEVESKLMYKDVTWQDGLAHQCRIHFLELKNVSKEPGICLNSPQKSLSDKDKCVDLFLKNESDHEPFAAPSTNSSCNTKDLYQEARTKLPVKTYTIKVYSRDFGAFGFLRSYANVNTHPENDQVSGPPTYESIPVKKTDVTHPDGRAKKTEYKDNRVTIPMDIDENRICDAGWTSAIGSVAIPDPASNTTDEDEKPDGDGQKGDGFSNYEEYRGFKIFLPAEIHQRLNIKQKDLFVCNEGQLVITQFETLSLLDVHQINELQFWNKNYRLANFNHNTANSMEQRGLHLVDAGNHTSLLGIAIPVSGNWPSPPNFSKVVNVYTGRIATFSTARNLVYATKEAQVIAHELSHACNVYHHGESPETNQNNLHGVRSGNFDCIMRYDNAAAPGGEAIGNSVCTSGAGTGYNTNEDQPGFGNADSHGAQWSRGNCLHQYRIRQLASDSNYPKRHD